MKTLPQHMLLSALFLNSAQAIAFPTDLKNSLAVTKAINHTTVRGRSGGVLAHLGSDGSRELLTPLHLIQLRNADSSHDVTDIHNSETLNHADLEGLAKRSTGLYALHIPFHERKGYIAVYLSNTTAIPVCKNVLDALYEDSAKVFLELKVNLGNTTTKIPVREDKVIKLCQSFQSKDDDNSNTTILSSDLATTTEAVKKNTFHSENDDESKIPRASTASKAYKSTAPKSTDATFVEGHATSSESDSAPTIPFMPKKITKTILSTSDEPTTKPKSAAPSTTETDDESSTPNLDLLSAFQSIAVSKMSELPRKAAESSISMAKDLTTQTQVRRKAFHNDPATTTSDIGDGLEATPTDDGPTITEPPSTKDATIAAAREPYLTMSSLNSWYDYINSHMIPALPTPGDAVGARVLENGGAPRLAFWWQRHRNNGASKTRDNAKVEGPTWSRIPAKPCLSSSSTHKTNPFNTPIHDPKLTLLKTPDPSIQSSPLTKRPTPTSISTSLAPLAKPALSSLDVDTISFSFPTPTPAPHHPSPSDPDPSSENMARETGAPSSAWGHVADPRMRWTVAGLWFVAVLQILLGFWEFVKGVRGRRRLGWEVGRMEWVERRVNRAG
ncbi:hypothetical protein BDU57DRAFT_531866 [Ampelomyces quisqualis]|uniref:Uncharacterized protein n=1 Tax=Ampelomyces quisqualis TaxID=50730 RepID=A0A6A5QHT3_AMPQU|nr:hypothetical protein BDU57DRAFT_531866 [Ampelomyces quisqualis]